MAITLASVGECKGSGRWGVTWRGCRRRLRRRGLVFLTVAGIAGASLVPTCNPQGYFPDGIKDTTMKAYEGAGLGDVFSAKAEMINGRAAMLGMAVFIATATIF